MIAAVGGALLLAVGPRALADQWAINWSTINGGGGTSTGGLYAVSGTIGQPDAGSAMTGGPYSLAGGFWPMSIQTPEAPDLKITLNHDLSTVELSWSPETLGWVLQETLSLSSTNWVDSPTGTNNPAVVPATLSARFYRLHKP